MKANIALMAGALFLLSGCGWEQEEAAYDSFAAARDAGAVKRGWIPEWLPNNSSDFKEKHDLDTNSCILRFSFARAEKWTPPSSCKQIAADQVRSPRIKASWWPNGVSTSSLATPRHSFFQCGEEFLALDTNENVGFFWRP